MKIRNAAVRASGRTFVRTEAFTSRGTPRTDEMQSLYSEPHATDLRLTYGEAMDEGHSVDLPPQILRTTDESQSLREGDRTIWVESFRQPGIRWCIKCHRKFEECGCRAAPGRGEDSE